MPTLDEITDATASAFAEKLYGKHLGSPFVAGASVFTALQATKGEDGVWACEISDSDGSCEEGVNCQTVSWYDYSAAETR